MHRQLPSRSAAGLDAPTHCKARITLTACMPAAHKCQRRGQAAWSFSNGGSIQG